MGHIGFVRHGIEAVVDALVDVAVVVAALHESSNGAVVAWLGRADVVVIGDVHVIPGFTEPPAGLVGLLLGGEAVGFGCSLDF